MNQLIVIIVVGLMVLTSVSGVFILTDNLSTDSDVLINNDSRSERTVESDNGAFLDSNYIENGDGKFDNTKLSLGKFHINHGLAIVSDLDATKVHIYNNQITLLYNLYTQSALFSYTNGVRAPPSLT